MVPIEASIARDVLREIFANAVMGIAPVREWRINRPRAGTAFTGDVKLLDRYAFQALRGIERYVGNLEGKTVVEFGPGDTLSAGLAILAAGATRYATLDRFVPDYSRPAAKRWYAGVRTAWASAFPDRPWPENLDPERFPEDYPTLVGHILGSVEEASAESRFHVVSSWQVGEHVLDVSAFASLTARLLLPGGVAVHRVDFGPHDCWRSYDDPLTFLRIPSPVWNAMGRNRGLPNRVRHHEFMRAWEGAGLAVECSDVTKFEPSDIKFDRVRPPYREASRDSLLVRDVVYLCRHSHH